MTRRCDCHDLLPADCETLLRADARRAVERAEELDRCVRLIALPGIIPANYAGRCWRCQEPYLQGTPIRAYNATPDTLVWIADCCLNDDGSFKK